MKIIKENDAKVIIFKILAALKYFKDSQNILIHYDLKPENIMFDEHGQLKIIDFGLCKILRRNKNVYTNSHSGGGTYHYLPPECFNP